MPTANDILQVLISDLEAELAPLNSIYHNFAQYKVDAGFDGGFYLEVHAPAHVQIFVPKIYQSFPVRFVEWEPNGALDLTVDIDVSMFFHRIYD